MPYKLRKKPNHDLYWVVNKETGKKYSKEAIPKDRAKAQMKAMYGSGWLGDAWNAAKAYPKKILTKAIPVLTKAVNALPSSDELARPLFEGEHHMLLQLPNGKTGVGNYIGPGTQILKRLERGDPPRTASDAVAKRHDIDYELASGEPTVEQQVADVRRADERMVNSLNRIEAQKGDAPRNIFLGKNLIKAKMLGEDKNIISKEKFAGPRRVIPDYERGVLLKNQAELARQGYGRHRP